MKVLLLGGTGAMGVPLMEILSRDGCTVYVTSRSKRNSGDANIVFLQGNAMDSNWLRSILQDKRWDAIVDFMHYKPHELKARLNMLLDSTEHYFFLSSSRVYAGSTMPLNESSDRLLDVVEDKQFLATDEYALSKARCENVLKDSEHNNWTIIRPYITYFTDRIQLSIFEKEAWLYRALNGRSIVFSQELASKKTALTSGTDVASIIGKLILQKKGFSEAIHPVNCETKTWSEVLDIYCDAIEECTGKRPKIHMLENASDYIGVVGNTYKYKYDRSVDRVFNNTKVENVLGTSVQYTGIKDGVTQAISSFVDSGAKFKPINIKLEALFDKYTHEISDLSQFSTKEKMKYLIFRFTPYLKLKMRKQKEVWW